MSEDKNPLGSMLLKMVEQDPVLCARTLETLNQDEASDVIKSIPSNISVQIVQHLSDVYVAQLMRDLPNEQFGAIVDKLDSQRGAEILMSLTKEKKDVLLACLDQKKKREIQELLTYPQDSAGRIMSREFIALHDDIRVKDAVQKIRELAIKGKNAFYVYVIDKENRLSGVMNMRDMLLSNEESKLAAVMRKDVFKINSFMDREQIANELTSRRFFAAPVVDNEDHLLGVVKSDMLISGVQEEAAEDIQRMFGAGGDEKAFSSVAFSMKKRLPWLHVNLITAFMAASVVALFEDIIAKITILAVFLPVVAGQGGNAGAQSLAVVMRGLVMREIPKGKAKSIIIKETMLGLVNGTVIGLVTALVTWMWYGKPFLGVVIGLGMIVNLVAAGFSGAAIPLGMKKIGLDPAQCSSIILTTVTDIIGFFAFLGFAVIFQRFL